MPIKDCVGAKLLAKKAIQQCADTAAHHPVDGTTGEFTDLNMALIVLHNTFDKKTLPRVETELAALIAKLTARTSKTLRTQLTHALALVKYAAEECK